MNRSAAAALAAAAVIGIAGGTFAAATGLGGGEKEKDPGSASSSEPTTTGSTGRTETPTARPNTPAQLLYMDDAQIHDGYTHVAVSGFDLTSVRSLVRIRGGWLVVEGTSDQEPSFDVTVVASNGDTTPIGSVSGLWDINEDGSRFVAFGDGAYRVTDLTSGAVVDVAIKGPEGSDPAANAAFTGDAVLTGWVDPLGNQTVRRTDLTTGKNKDVMSGLISGWTASPRGLLMAGDVDDDGRPCIAGGQVVGDHGDWWDTCDWRFHGLRPQYSPNGEQVLVIPAETDGFGPGLFGVLDSENGRQIGEVDVPDWSITAEWGDNDEIFVLGQRDAEDTSAVIYRCRIDQECTTERESQARLVLGTGT